MRRALVLAMLLVVAPRAISGQTLVTLHIRAVLVDMAGRATPVARHALLISDNPQTVSTRRVFTRADGSAEVRLRPGKYTIESDQPVAFEGKAYAWTQRLDIIDGRDAVVELTPTNAEVEPIVPGTTSVPAPTEATSALSLEKWRDSVVAVWTPTTHASGFLVDARGLVATSRRAVGAATSVEVQLSPSVKVAGRVLIADRERDIAVVRIDPAVVASVTPVPLECTRTGTPALASGLEIVTIGAPLLREKRMSFGEVRRAEARALTADLTLATGSIGGPVFNAAGEVIGITAPADEGAERGEARVARIEDLCRVVADAQAKLTDFAAPEGTPLPVEPLQRLPVDTLKDAVQRRAGSLAPYRMTTADFDVAFLTPLVNYAAQSRPDTDFSNWSEYVADIPPVLLVRVTPKLGEAFWTKLTRGAASTQGIALPKIERFRSGFLRMRALCGSAEVTPIHPFTLERRVSSTEAINEGLYVFDPAALGPACGTVTLILYSEKEPGKADTRAVDPRVLQQIWRDFESNRR
jgi:S1-C subfamily serine protease